MLIISTCMFTLMRDNTKKTNWFTTLKIWLAFTLLTKWACSSVRWVTWSLHLFFLSLYSLHWRSQIFLSWYRYRIFPRRSGCLRFCHRYILFVYGWRRCSFRFLNDSGEWYFFLLDGQRRRIFLFLSGCRGRPDVIFFTESGSHKVADVSIEFHHWRKTGFTHWTCCYIDWKEKLDLV